MNHPSGSADEPLQHRGELIERDIIGPPISMTRPRSVESTITGSRSAATSAADTKSIGFFPRPKTKIFSHAGVRTTPLFRRCCSASYFARNNSIGLSGRAPTRDIRTNDAPTRRRRCDDEQDGGARKIAPEHAHVKVAEDETLRHARAERCRCRAPPTRQSRDADRAQHDPVAWSRTKWKAAPCPASAM